MSKVLVITFSNVKTDARVKRQISFFGRDYKVVVAAYDSPGEHNFIKISPPRLGLPNKVLSGTLLLLKLYDWAYQILYGQKLQINKDFDVIVANDVETLPLAFQYRGNAKIIFDAHEYAPRHFENKMNWRIFFQGFNTYLCRKFIPQVNAMITVGNGVALEYERNFGLKPIVITNAPHFHAIESKRVSPEKIRLVHQGIANPSRKLELMVEMMELLDDRFHLDLMLMEPTFESGKKYLGELKSLASKNSRIRFVPPKPTTELVAAINEYDIGVIMIPPVNFNYANTLPNKFFECIQARIAVATGPTPEIKKITEEFEIGVVSADFTARSMASVISTLRVSDIEKFKSNCNKAAAEFNAEKNQTIFKNLLTSI